MYKVEFRLRVYRDRVTLTVSNLETVEEVIVLARSMIEARWVVKVTSIILDGVDSWQVFEGQSCIGYLWITKV